LKVNRVTTAPRVVELWRYPVKSLLGERLDRALITAETLRDWDPRRFRANVYLDGGGEDDYVGRMATLGDALVVA
jgi:uncharacterized protein YcbX